MLKTAKPSSEGQSFHRRLLSEYNTDITLANYVDYFELKNILKDIVEVKDKIDEKVASLMKNTNTRNNSVVPSSPLAQMPRFPSVKNLDVQFRDTSAVFSEPLTPLTRIDDLTSKDPQLNNLVKEMNRMIEKFFDALSQSYKKVKQNLFRYEQELLVVMDNLHLLTDTDIRAKPAHYIPELYMKVETVNKYRSLNLLALRKILRKFLERCAKDSLELQRRVYNIDSLIASSRLCKPSVDLRGIVMELIAVYGTVFKLSYEGTYKQMKAFCRRSGINAQRIIPFRDSFFFTDAFPYSERHFSIRVIPGSLSVQSVKMITEVLQCERFKGPCCSKFANGEVNIHLNEPVRGDDVFIVQSISSTEDISNGTAIMELALMIHSAQLAAASRITAVIPHLAYTKNVASISALAEVIECVGCNHVITVDMHSDQVEGMFSIPLDSISSKYEFVRYLYNQLKEEQSEMEDLTIVAPKGNFLGKAKDFADAFMRYGELDSERQFVSVCTAVKRVKPLRTATPPPTSVTPVNTSRNTAQDESPVSDTCGRSPPNRVSPVSSLAAPFPASAEHDVHVNELAEVMEGYTGALEQNEHRSSSTFGIEKALLIQEKGRRGIVTHQLEDADCIALVGDVKNRVCIILETVIDEAVNITQVAKCLQSHGAKRIILIATHCVLSGKAKERLESSPIELIITTDSVEQDSVMKNANLAKKLRVLPLAPLMARAIDKIHTENTLVSLYEAN
ncbi:ribose-phosphate pyrophosphokinase [Angomonas deanei]|uniref:N-terminal domain of ribose phosphate pyrophosphokinase/Phosphoribosyl synthetase-associated domain containing protein, putative n=1 Tax=Angomonas deanei TaxID=59799 RepID=A0A7G2CEE2_9TRYP|nr:ribose-phosphate pyrophosphokinase [Angomonas deanei]CAD2217053.1 N-terminal domain of ribose phosphate pyrophosphokinase/Phosphoribosyl synthetase-associated domain containing protein, putative [Angomonas deanei]|eukprot:EPY24133.1 ribose-phosphate pyrophosphokinase [Angomonas deanei]